MSSLWTPGGERPVGPSPATDPVPGGRGSPGPMGALPDDDASRAAFEAEMAAAREQLEQLPAGVVVAQLTLQLYELAAIHLSRTPPALDQAKVAIDAMAAVVERVGTELGDNQQTLRDALTQLQMAFVELTNRHEAGTSPGPGRDTAE